MFQTIDEGLTAYERELAAFQEWVKPVDDRFADSTRTVRSWADWLPWAPKAEPCGWPTEEIQEARKWRTKLKGMEVALGLTPDEIRDKFQAAGFSVVKQEEN